MAFSGEFSWENTCVYERNIPPIKPLPFPENTGSPGQLCTSSWRESHLSPALYEIRAYISNLQLGEQHPSQAHVPTSILVEIDDKIGDDISRQQTNLHVSSSAPSAEQVIDKSSNAAILYDICMQVVAEAQQILN